MSDGHGGFAIALMDLNVLPVNDVPTPGVRLYKPAQIGGVLNLDLSQLSDAGQAELPGHPAAAHRKHLADKARGRVAAQISRKLSVLARGHQAAQRHLALQALLELGVGQHRRRKVSRVGDKVLACCWHACSASRRT